LRVNTVKQIWPATILFCGISTVTAAQDQHLYVFRLDHSNSEGHSCALLQTTGAFHSETNDGDNVRVSEGTIGPDELTKIEADLNNGALANLSQQQIQEPLIRTRHDEVQLSVFRGETWQDLFFQSSDSQQPFKHSLQPLIHWLDTLSHIPHRELSEDEGANRCLPVGTIALKKRGEAPSESVVPRTTMHVLYGGSEPQPQIQPALPIAPQSVSPLLFLNSFERRTESAREWCALIVENGMYRFEDRTQKAGKPVKTRIAAGQIGPGELLQLHQILDSPSLVSIQHREPPGRGDVAMMRDKLDLFISRPAGVQHFILSSHFNGPHFPSFYRGDADATVAQPLLKFLGEHIENNAAGILNPNQRSVCTEAP